MAAIWATVATLAFLLVPPLNRSNLIGYFHFPAIFLAVVFSNDKHSPSEFAIFSSFIAYALFYWAVFEIIYAIGLEFFLVRKHAHKNARITMIATLLTTGETREALSVLGITITDIERSRRNHWVLRKSDEINISSPQSRMAAYAIRDARKKQPVKRLLKHIQREVARSVGVTEANELMTQLLGLATKIAGENDGPSGTLR